MYTSKTYLLSFSEIDHTCMGQIKVGVKMIFFIEIDSTYNYVNSQTNFINTYKDTINT